MTLPPFGGVFLLAASVVLAACSSDGSVAFGGSRDGGMGGAHAAGGSAGANAGGTSGASGTRGTGGLAIGMARCGELTCSPIHQAGVESSACCTDSGACGYRLPLSTKCLGINMPGHITPECPRSNPGGTSVSGCCSPTGCGALLTLAGIGCVSNQDLGRPAMPCVFDNIGTGGAPGDASPDAP